MLPRRFRFMAANAWRLSRLAALVVGVIFLLSSLPKLRHPHAFLEDIYGYELVGPKMGMLIAMTLPWLELIIAVNLLVGSLKSGSLLAAAILAAAFTFANSWAVSHGLAVSCGCFGYDLGGAPIGWGTVLRSSFILVLPVVGLITPVLGRRREPAE